MPEKGVVINSPSFISISQEQQLQELAKYMQSIGCKKLNNEQLASLGNWQNQLYAIIKELGDTMNGKSIAYADVESVLNGIVSLLPQLQANQLTPAVNAFCEAVASLKLAQAADEARLPAAAAAANMQLRSAYKLAPLQNLFHLLPDSKVRYTVYLAMVTAAADENKINHIVTDRLRLRNWLEAWNCNQAERQQLWRNLQQAFTKCGNNSAANACLLDLMNTYTDADASKAKDEAVECIVSTLSDDSVYIMDHLLSLKPISFLEGELIHNLLTIFVNGSLSDYLAFKEKNKQFVQNLNISSSTSDSCLAKMRLLTLMRLAENRQELDYSLLETELRLKSDELEEFIIDAATKEAVFCKIDEVQRKVLVYGTTHRTFGRAQWTSLRETLQQWRENLHVVQKNLQLLTPGQEAADSA